jgi:hypothetical protein
VVGIVVACCLLLLCLFFTAGRRRKGEKEQRKHDDLGALEVPVGHHYDDPVVSGSVTPATTSLDGRSLSSPVTPLSLVMSPAISSSLSREIEFVPRSRIVVVHAQ